MHISLQAKIYRLEWERGAGIYPFISLLSGKLFPHSFVYRGSQGCQGHLWSVFIKSYLSFKLLDTGSTNYMFYKLLTLMHNKKLLSCKVPLNMGSFKWTALGRRFQQHVRKTFPKLLLSENLDLH